MFFSSRRVSAKRCRQLLLASLVSGALYSPALHADQSPVPPTATVSCQKDGSVVLPDSQVIRLAGRQITFIGRPCSIAVRLWCSDYSKESLCRLSAVRYRDPWSIPGRYLSEGIQSVRRQREPADADLLVAVRRSHQRNFCRVPDAGRSGRFDEPTWARHSTIAFAFHQYSELHASQRSAGQPSRWTSWRGRQRLRPAKSNWPGKKSQQQCSLDRQKPIPQIRNSWTAPSGIPQRDSTRRIGDKAVLFPSQVKRSRHRNTYDDWRRIGLVWLVLLDPIRVPRKSLSRSFDLFMDAPPEDIPSRPYQRGSD